MSTTSILQRPQGSVFMALFSADGLGVATGFSPGDGPKKLGVRKLFGGEMEDEDFALSQSVEEGIRVCVFRELLQEAGVRETNLQFFAPAYVQKVSGTNRRTGKDYAYENHTWLGVAEEGLVLPSEVEDRAEMLDRRFDPVPDVLKSYGLEHGHKEKFNPYHAIALVRCLIKLEKLLGRSSEGTPFHRMMEDMRRRMNLDSLTEEIQDKINARFV